VRRDFAARFPSLLHVTDSTALPLIGRHGLLSAEALCALFAVPGAEALLAANRDRYVTLRHPIHGEAALRRQKMPEAGLAARLGPGLTPGCWRRFINAHVFFWVKERDARALDGAEPGRAQVTLRLRTAVLVAAGLQVLASPVNGGSLDRAKPGTGRAREPGLYRPVHAVAPGEVVREVAVRGSITPDLLAAARLG
jgi:hypothetical protein